MYPREIDTWKEQCREELELESCNSVSAKCSVPEMKEVASRLNSFQISWQPKEKHTWEKKVADLVKNLLTLCITAAPWNGVELAGATHGL